MKHIELGGVRQNNLKNIDVKVPIGSFTVVCGPSGSGKSSLAFQTLYAEGQRRYIESLSNYTKQFLNKAPKPDVETVSNIPPSIAIEQKNSVRSSRSTVGTTTEITDYLRLLYEKIGKAYCPDHHIPLEKQSPTQAAKAVLDEFEGKRGYILAPITADQRLLKGKKLQQFLLSEGFVRIYKPGSVVKKAKIRSTKKTTAKMVRAKKDHQLYSQVSMGEVLELTDKSLNRGGVPKEEFYLVVDRVGFKSSEQGRLADSIRQAYKATTQFNKDRFHGQAIVITTDGEQLLVSENTSCSVCGFEFPDIDSKLFSFNSPTGACPTCNGFGNILQVDEAKVIPDPTLSIAQGAIAPFAMPSGKSDKKELLQFCNKEAIDIHKPWNKLSQKDRTRIWDGTEDFYGVLGLFEYLETKKYKMHVRVFLARHKSPFACTDCKGTRLRKEASQVLVHGHSLTEISAFRIQDLLQHFEQLELTDFEAEVCQEILRQLIFRLQFLMKVGVGYLGLDRATKTLSGGEYQRLTLANQLGMGLSQTLYVLDEPTIGLHPRDNDRLIEVLKNLRELGNTLVIVEHDKDVIESASHIVEMGPGSGHLGGEVIFEGRIDEFYQFKDSKTVPYLANKKLVAIDKPDRPSDPSKLKHFIELKGCKGHNLKNIDVRFPLNRLVTVTGVSGSGKSSLVSQTLYPALARHLKLEFKPGLEFNSMTGHDQVTNVLYIDQTPVGKTARSNPVTYLKVYDHIRQLFANTPEAKAFGYTTSTFSLNVDGGRCPVCKGLGVEVIDMMFMDDIEIPCEGCGGKRFRDEVLDVKYKNRSISQILEMTVEEAMDFFVDYPKIRKPLTVLKEVGLQYLRLGQKASSLSGGESQRLKVAREINSTGQRGTLYILDEPTTGLHFGEIKLLLDVLNKLVEAGGSVVLIEHNLEVINNSDYIIDIGPEAGDGGGKLVAQGPPEDIIKAKDSHTGRYLKQHRVNQ